MRPAIASTFYKDEVQNASVIYNTALCCIFFNSLRERERGTIL